MAESADVLSGDAPAGDPARPRRRLLDGRHGRARSARAVLGRSRADARRRRAHRSRHLHQLRRVDQSVLRRARRRRLHLVERGGDAEVGVGARRARSCSCPISISAATPPTRWACRSIRWWCGIRTRSGAASSPTPSSRRASSCGRATARCTRASPCGRSNSVRAQHPGIRVIVHPEVPWDVVQAADDSGSTEYIIKTGEREPGRIDLGRRHRDPPRQSPRARRCSPTAPCCRSTSSAACARRCSACRRTICSGSSKGSSPARSTTASSCPTTQKHWTKVALDRMLSIS